MLRRDALEDALEVRVVRRQRPIEAFAGKHHRVATGEERRGDAETPAISRDGRAAPAAELDRAHGQRPAERAAEEAGGEGEVVLGEPGDLGDAGRDRVLQRDVAPVARQRDTLDRAHGTEIAGDRVEGLADRRAPEREVGEHVHLALGETLAQHQADGGIELGGAPPERGERAPGRAQLRAVEIGAIESCLGEQVIAASAALVEQLDQEAGGDGACGEGCRHLGSRKGRARIMVSVAWTVYRGA